MELLYAIIAVLALACVVFLVLWIRERGVNRTLGDELLTSNTTLQSLEASLSAQTDELTEERRAREQEQMARVKAETELSAERRMMAEKVRSQEEVERTMRARAKELLDIFGLLEERNNLAYNLPYGKQRKLEIARALATGPKLLLLDEPAAGMNPQETQELAELIKQIRDKYNLTIFLIEHHMDLVMRISDYIYVIDFGSEIAQGVPKDVQANQRVIDAYLGVAEDE
jgi:ABC-type branched-subunit amino acid transport system ATPase component